MKKQIRRAALQALRGLGLFRLARESRWRRQRLLILCFHGVSQFDEHLWRPALYIEPARLEQRLEMLKQGQHNVLLLEDALQQLSSGNLPPRSVALTFDDGMSDFYTRAFPLLKRHDFPATVYQTTYYIQHAIPVFNLICSYMLWKRRGELLELGKEVGLAPAMDLRTESSRTAVGRKLIEAAERNNLSGPQKNELAARLAAVLDIDYTHLQASRVLQLMNAREIAELSAQGVGFQLHTHRHRVPVDETLFRQEIRENRSRLQAITGREPTHFCYPSGVYDSRLLPWLAEEGILSATTCDPGLATAHTNLLLLPRFVDTTGRSTVEFEAWLTGLGEWV